MKEIKNILVPIDFSDNSKKILHSAKFVAGKFSAKLHILFVVQSFDDYSGFFVPHLPISQFEEEMQQGAEKKMQNFLFENMGETYSGEYESKVVCGDVAGEIINYVSEQGVDMIVMGTHGYKGFEKALFGSVAEKVVKTSPCPVLTINPYNI